MGNVEQFKPLARYYWRRSTLAVFIAYLASKLSFVSALAATDDHSTFDQFVDKTGGENSFLVTLSDKVVPWFTGLGAIVLLVSAIVCCMKLGASAMFGDPRGRQENIVGLVVIFFAAVVMLHVRQILGMASSIS